MVDNRVSSVSTAYFKAGDASGMANKMSEEKQGQGGEYFAQDMQEEQEQQKENQNFQDRSAILRASLNGLAVANVGLVRFNQAVREQKEKREQEEKKKQREAREVFTRFDEIFKD